MAMTTTMSSTIRKLMARMAHTHEGQGRAKMLCRFAGLWG
jgi:hypothetical protein